MPNQVKNKLPHFILSGTSEASVFTARSSPHKKVERDDLLRAQHGASLWAQLQALKPIAHDVAKRQQELELEGGLGLQIQFRSLPQVELAFESLGNERSHIELLSVHTEGDYTVASVFVPDGKLAHFEKYITDYLNERKKSNGDSLDNKALLETIETIRTAEVRALWTDEADLLPENPDVAFWWEVWLPERQHREAVIADFRKLAVQVGCKVSAGRVDFPERTVVLMFGSQQQLTQSVLLLNTVAELRRAKETAEFFDSMTPLVQHERKDELLARCTFVPESNDIPRVCLLDSGVNRGHPLLEPVLASADLHAAQVPYDDVGDTADHGTGLAGVAVYGDLSEVLEMADPIHIAHRLESVKLVQKEASNAGDADLHAQLFSDAVSRPEISAPQRCRIFSCAVTATDYRDKGRPSSWSSMVDSLAADANGDGLVPRLIILAAGNTKDHQAWITYPDSLSTNLIHDPGQAWNALTVGAFTRKVDTQSRKDTAVAPLGGPSPYTTTSATWDKAWPRKPDVVFEGGNVGKDAYGAANMPSLSLLTTHFKPIDRLFTTTNATSAASALAARMAAQLRSTYPTLRPETIRGLIVHSARWTKAMREMYLHAENKNDYQWLIRHCGWGVPNLERARWSASNSLTLIIEDTLSPYQKTGSGIKTRDMHVHTLPWPKEELEALGAAEVSMRVTLSYFVEPNPSARGSASKYHYPSHRLRFDVCRPREDKANFMARINKAAILDDEDDVPVKTSDPDWRLGDQYRHKGSLHQDVWQGTAADLASRGFLAIYPANGWWRTRPKLARYDMPARYSLIVSIRTPNTEVDLYAAVEAQIKTPVIISS